MDEDGAGSVVSFHSLPEWTNDEGLWEQRRPKKRRFLWANGRTTSSLDVEVVDQQVAIEPPPPAGAVQVVPTPAPPATKFRAITWKPVDDDVILRETKGSRGWPWSR